MLLVVKVARHALKGQKYIAQGIALGDFTAANAP